MRSAKNLLPHVWISPRIQRELKWSTSLSRRNQDLTAFSRVILALSKPDRLHSEPKTQQGSAGLFILRRSPKLYSRDDARIIIQPWSRNVKWSRCSPVLAVQLIGTIGDPHYSLAKFLGGKKFFRRYAGEMRIILVRGSCDSDVIFSIWSQAYVVVHAGFS